MTSRETKRINGDCRGTVSSQHSADIKGSPEFLWNVIGGPWTTSYVCLDQDTRERELSWYGGCGATCTARIVVRFPAYRLAVQPAEPPLENRYKVKRQERETDKSLATSDEVRNVWSSTCTFSYAFKACKGINFPSVLNIYINRIYLSGTLSLSVNMPINMEQFLVMTSEIISCIRKHHFHYKPVTRILINVVNYSKHKIILFTLPVVCLGWHRLSAL